MRSGRLDEPCFSYGERRQGVATSSHSFRSRALSGRRSPGRERQRRVSPNFVVVRVLVRVDQAAARRNAGAFAPDPTGRFERSLCRITKLRASLPTAACNSGPGTTENYVEARAATPLSRPHRSLLCTVLQLPSAHSCDMCIGAVALNRWRGRRTSTAVRARRWVSSALGLENDGQAVRSIHQPIFLSCPSAKCRKRRLGARLARVREGTKWVSRNLP